ncbi:MAG TPA: CehA/McbA family metallohydrolase [Chthoniobacteraceae bacterium]|jgi:hypothetical protein|nr:CehA/McbA family metallohydrolase [Chthoniobacteraceae bacterium]
MNRLRLAFLCCFLTVRGWAADPIVLSEQRWFLGAPGVREWRDFDAETPDGPSLSLKFAAHANPHEEATLFIRQRDVKLGWTVLLNGRNIGHLQLNEVLLESVCVVPAGALREGENTLSIVPQAEGDDIIIDRIRLAMRAPDEALAETTLWLDARDADSGEHLPCRFTIVDAAGALAPLGWTGQGPWAGRPGVIYTATGWTKVFLPAGRYTVYCTRGFEYGLDTRQVELPPGKEVALAFKIRREVPTPGLVACDTHVHTFTFSKHGDATIDERMVTLAGEGIELPVSTDHNVYADYGEAVQRMQVQPWFTWLLGCEVTTAAGHFNAFPIANAQAPLPDTKLTDWPALMQSIRNVPGVQAIVLNHPRDVHNNFIPFAEKNFNSGSGDRRRGPEFTFDAIEVANSGTLQSDLSRSWRDWFALLNHGYRTVAVGSSDSHDVSRFIVGQGRTYIACDDHDVARIDTATALKNFKAGHAYVSLGLLTTISVEDKFGPGDTATGLGAEVRVTVRVLGPSWTRAEKVDLYANGLRLRSEAIAQPSQAGEKAAFTWTIPKPRYDTWLVAIATGPGVREPYWNIPFPYQPTDRLRDPQVLGLTNPVYLDADGDGHFTSPRGTAQAILTKIGADPEKLLPALAEYDEAVVTQVAALCEAQVVEIRGAAFQELLLQAAEHVRRGFANYLSPAP